MADCGEYPDAIPFGGGQIQAEDKMVEVQAASLDKGLPLHDKRYLLHFCRVVCVYFDPHSVLLRSGVYEL